MDFSNKEYTDLLQLFNKVNNSCNACDNTSKLLKSTEVMENIVTLLNKCKLYENYRFDCKLKPLFDYIYAYALINYSDLILLPSLNNNFLCLDNLPDFSLINETINNKLNAIKLLQNALCAYKSTKNEIIDLIAKQHNCLGILYYSINNPDLAQEHYSSGASLGNMECFINLSKMFANFEINIEIICSSYDDILHLSDTEDNFAKKIASTKIIFDSLYNTKNFDTAVNVLNNYRSHVMASSGMDYITTQDDSKLAICQSIYNECMAKLSIAKQNLVANEELLLEFFDKSEIPKMTNEIKVLITTSIIIEKYIKSQNKTSVINLDYSACTISIIKALEIILSQILAVDYLKYLNTLDNINLYHINNCLKYRKNDGQYTLKTSMDFTLANAIFMVSNQTLSDQPTTINKYFKQYCEANKINDAENFVTKFVCDMRKIVNIRNGIAHKACISNQDCEIIFDLLLNTKRLIKKLYNTFAYVFERKNK